MNDISDSDSWKSLSSNAGMFSRFSLVNTLQKKLFRVVALSSFDLANLFPSSRSAIPLLVFNLLLAYALKALGLLLPHWLLIFQTQGVLSYR